MPVVQQGPVGTEPLDPDALFEVEAPGGVRELRVPLSGHLSYLVVLRHGTAP